MGEFFKEWSGVMGMACFVFWVAYNIHNNWRNRAETKSKDSDDEFGAIRNDIEKIENRLKVVEILWTVPEKPEMHYDPSKGITLLSPKES